MRAVALPSPFFVITSKTLIISSAVLLTLSALFGILNLQKTRGLRTEVSQSEVTLKTTEQARISREKGLKAREEAVAAATAKFGDTNAKAASTEAELLKAQTEKNDLQAKVRANETEIAELRRGIEETEKKPGAVPSTASPPELQAQLEDAKKQLDAAEREKVLLAEKMRTSQERASQPHTEKKHHPTAGGVPGIRGTVLAVNQAYNFVVLSLGSP